VDARSSRELTGRTAEGRRIVLTLAGDEVVRVRAGVLAYRCETFGDLGPVVADKRGGAPVSRRGRFGFTGGEAVERLTVAGTFTSDRRSVAGTLRLRGTIATGQRCTSAPIRFTAAR
jgi:hypothetical protein